MAKRPKLQAAKKVARQTIRQVARNNDLNVKHVVRQLDAAHVTPKSIVAGAYPVKRTSGVTLKKATRQVARGVTRNVTGLNKPKRSK